jgi:glycosyltransferase involved in cell wall biosynthesis
MRKARGERAATGEGKVAQHRPAAPGPAEPSPILPCPGFSPSGSVSTYSAGFADAELAPLAAKRGLALAAIEFSDDKRQCRIGFVIDVVYPFSIGGRERRLWEIARRLKMAGVEVHIYTMNWWDGEDTLDLGGVQLHAICKRRPLYRGNRRSIMQALMFGLATFKLIGARFDILDVDHMPYFPLFAARIICTLRRKRMIATWHEVCGSAYWRSYLGRLAPISTVTEWLAARMAKEIVAVSYQTSIRLIDQLGVTAPVHTIELGVDLDTIAAQQESELRSDILFVGRLLANKNVNVLLEALASMKKELPGLCCRIVGEGPERSRLESLSIDLGLEENVIFHDHFPGSAIYGVMKSSKVFALPSEREGFGIVALEANACGLPVVTADHPDNATRHLIRAGENGFLANVDAAGLADALSIAINRASSIDPRASAQRSGYLRDWDEVAAAVLHAATGGRSPRPDRRPRHRETPRPYSRRAPQVLGLGRQRGPETLLHPDRATDQLVPPQRGPVPAARHRQARTAAADRSAQH